MEPTRCAVKLLPDGEMVEVPVGSSLHDALLHLGIELNLPCGGEGTCVKCRVQVVEGELQPLASEERALLSSGQLSEGQRLGCRAKIQEAVTVAVPPASRAAALRILPAGTRRQVLLESAVSKQAVRPEPQTLAEPHARLEQLRRCGDLRADLTAGIDLLRRLPDLLPDSSELVTVVMRGPQLLDVEPGDTADRCFGLAVDLGTTTVVAALVDLTSGKMLGQGVDSNRQAAHGHDVISRINMSMHEPDGLGTLRLLALDSVHNAVAQVLDRQGVSESDVYEMTLAGNATMMHLCLGISPASLGAMPYVSVVGDAVDLGAQQFGLSLHPAARVHVLPNIAGYVGGDTVAAILAAEFDEDDGRTRLLADIGTNCELVLRRGDRLIVTSTPAGPAFEGARISCGMYAVPGAIEAVRLNGDALKSENGGVSCKVIGEGVAQGLCGSGLVDAVAELVRLGIVDETGRILDEDELPDSFNDSLRPHLITIDDQAAFLLADPAGGSPVSLTQRDLRELQLAKGAIRSAIDLLLEKGGVAADDVDEFCIAGGFGTYLDRQNAIGIGLLPPVPTDRISYIGNGALMGASAALMSTSLRRRSAQLARLAEHLQIAGTPDFQNRFTEAMMFEPNVAAP